MAHWLILTQSLLVFPSFASASHFQTSKIHRRANDNHAQPYDPFYADAGFDIRSVVETSMNLPTHSWEFGTQSEALLELFNPELSIYGADPFGEHSLCFDPEAVKALVYAKEKIVIGTGANALSDGDGAVGDPASLVEYVYASAPHWPNGAISQRADHAELWADFVYMAPPYLAYWGVVEKNATTLKEAVSSCAQYRDVLHMSISTNAIGVLPNDHHNEAATGLWQHIIGTTWADRGLWSTGNGWAAAGMMRVLATVIRAPKEITEGFRSAAIAQVSGLIREILDAAIRIPRDKNNLLRNYLDDESWFGEISGSSILASVAYRMSTFSEEIGLSREDAWKYAGFAEDIRLTIGKGNHITANGTATPAVNPLDWNDRKEFTRGSPEGNSFVILLYSAYRDCLKAKAPGC